MEDLYIPENERFFGKKEIDTRKLIYEYWWIDFKKASQKLNRFLWIKLGININSIHRLA